MTDPLFATAARVRNWGRWGPDDERGTLNFIGPGEVAAAAGLVREGRTFGLGVPLGPDGPQDGGTRPNPRLTVVRRHSDPTDRPGRLRYADDKVEMHLQAATQWDALAHVSYDGRIYNGFAADIGAAGATRCAVTAQFPGVVGRGVLLDCAAHRSVAWLPAGTAIEAVDLDEIAARSGVVIRPGDIVLVRTGWWQMFERTRDAGAFKGGEPGLGLSCLQWLHDHRVAAVGADNFAVEVVPSPVPGQFLPFHMVAIRDMGMPLAEILNLGELANYCRRAGRFEFLFVGPVLPFIGAVGSPSNPIAIV